MQLQPEITDLIERGALFVVNHSGGKDSQAMLIFLRRHVPEAQLIIVHARLGEVEWDGCEALIERYAADLPVLYAEAGKTFFDMVERRGKFPSPQQRQCTSDLKRDPIAKVIRAYLREHPEFGGLVVNCMGLRAQESSGRSKLAAFTRNARNSLAGRSWYDWLPIHGYSTDQVFAEIADAGQEPHWVYAAGMSRKSCAFCIMASDADLRRAALLRPALHAKYAATERRLNFTLSMSGRSLPQITGVAA